MTRVQIGIRVEDRGDLLSDTLKALDRTAGETRRLILLDGAAAPTPHRDRRVPDLERVVAWSHPRGMAECFNALTAAGEADVYVLLENGARPAPGWLERLLAALAADPRCGLAGPSTNLCWNEQAAFTSAGTAGALERAARRAAQRFGDSVSLLEPLHSLAEFCYAVKREVVEAIGIADPAYGLGPCWEMDYNIRAARAGFRAVWVRGAYVWRHARAPRRRAREVARLETAKQLYQDRFCGLRLADAARSGGSLRAVEPHCRGEACAHFAPSSRIRIRLTSPRPRAASPAHPGAASRRSTAPTSSLSGASTANRPLVSCLMPTRDRRPFVRAAIDAFLGQDYVPRELVIVDSGHESIEDQVPADPRIRYTRAAPTVSLGVARNLACDLARGDVLAHWDDDDWHAPWRLSYQVSELIASKADLVGLDRLWHYDPQRGRAWQYCYPSVSGHAPRWVAGGTFCYRRRLWSGQRFPDSSVGEDTLFVRQLPPERVRALARADFYVARVHGGNTSRKATTGSRWQEHDVDTIRRILGADFEPFRDLPRRATSAAPSHACAPGSTSTSAGATHVGRGRPLVSCIMPTLDRRPFIPLALERFFEQTYPHTELIIVDDSDDPVGDLVDALPAVTYLHLSSRKSIGHKRNLACAHAAGEVVVHWDDDDWYAPTRIERQVEPILAGRAELTGIPATCWMSVPAGRFWSLSARLHRRMFVGDVSGGTLAFARALFTSGVRYPDTSLAEDAAFLRSAVQRGARLERVQNDALYVYTRHDTNAWRIDVGHHADPRGWTRTAPPARMPKDLIDAYRLAARSLVGRRASA